MGRQRPTEPDEAQVRTLEPGPGFPGILRECRGVVLGQAGDAVGYRALMAHLSEPALFRMFQSGAYVQRRAEVEMCRMHAQPYT